VLGRRKLKAETESGASCEARAQRLTGRINLADLLRDPRWRDGGRPMKRRILRNLYLVVALPAAVACATGGAPAWERRVGSADVEAYRALVEQLADDAMEGRGVTTQGNARATALLAEEFRAADLAPAGDAGGYAQCFEQPVAVHAAAIALARDGAAV
jgi:hypothetical protein